MHTAIPPLWGNSIQNCQKFFSASRIHFKSNQTIAKQCAINFNESIKKSINKEQGIQGNIDVAGENVYILGKKIWIWRENGDIKIIASDPVHVISKFEKSIFKVYRDRGINWNDTRLSMMDSITTICSIHTRQVVIRCWKVYWANQHY